MRVCVCMHVCCVLPFEFKDYQFFNIQTSFKDFFCKKSYDAAVLRPALHNLELLLTTDFNNKSNAICVSSLMYSSL